MHNKIAIYGGSFNPPGIHHRRIAQALVENGFQVIIVPCGPRPDKLTVDDTDPVHRAAMADMTFGDLPGVEVWLNDLERNIFTRTHELERLFSERGEVWHYVGADLVIGGHRGESLIQRKWQQGTQLWNRSRFVVGSRPGYTVESADLPPHHVRLGLDFGGSSTEIRERSFARKPIDGLVIPEVQRYLDRYSLYRGRLPRNSALFHLDDPRPMVLIDEGNDRAVTLGTSLMSNDIDPNSIVVIGGDGMMLHAIKREWRRRLPFFGINRGHRGFLLNTIPDDFTVGQMSDLLVYQHPLLFVEVEDRDGDHREFFAFNDAWFERTSPQTAHLSVTIDDIEKFPRIVSDGALVATPAGSSAYAHIMGATPMRIGSQGLLLVGNNVIEPWGWKAKPLPIDAVITMRALNPGKRPVRACIDNEFVENAVMMRIRASRTAAVELACLPDQDLADKLEHMLFPNIP